MKTRAIFVEGTMDPLISLEQSQHGVNEEPETSRLVDQMPIGLEF